MTISIRELGSFLESQTLVFRRLIDVSGRDNQLTLAMEELAELIQAINKYRREKNVKNVAEEFADVMIMLKQIAVMMPPGFMEMVDESMDKKFTRIEDLLRNA